MKKKAFALYGLGLLSGLALAAVLLLFLRAPQSAAGPVFSALPHQPTALSGTLPAAGQSSAAKPALAAEWDKSAVYLGGDQAAYGGKIYRAKWWTQGETPGQADVWEDTLIRAEPPAPSTTPVMPAIAPVPGQSTDFKVVGYFPSWKTDTSKLRYDILTHINYAFAIPTADGGLRPLENPQTAQKIIADAHRSGVKVLLAVGGWSYNDTPLEATFVQATTTAEKRASLINAIMTLCTQYGFDGVDMDWEHPRTDGTSSQQYEALMLELAHALHAQGMLLSAAVLSGATPDGNIYYDAQAHTDAVLAAVDYINVMAYDGGDGSRHSAYDFAESCGRYWRDDRGLNPSKVVLGVPFYARPSWAAYGDILAAQPNAWQSDHVLYNGMDVYYNGAATIQKKTRYAQESLGGIMIWEVSQDAPGEHSLLLAIHQALKANQ